MESGANPEILLVSSLSGTWFAVLFFSFISIAIGYCVYALLAKPASRRPEFREFGRVSKPTSVILGALVAGVILSLIWQSTISGFHSVEIDGRSLRLRYLFPWPDDALHAEELVRLEKKYAYKSRWRLELVTGDGRRYTSAQSNAAVVEATRLRLAQWASE